MIAPETTDDNLVRAFRNGDEAAMDALVARHGPSLMAYLRARSPEAEDVFQETWFRAIRKINHYKKGSFRAWLIVIARNGMIDGFRRKRPTASLDAEDDRGLSMADTLPGTTVTAPEILASGESHQRLLEQIEALPAAQREVFMLRTQQELSFAEIAKLLKIPLNTALGRMHYAVTKLRQEWKTEP